MARMKPADRNWDDDREDGGGLYLPPQKLSAGDWIAALAIGAFSALFLAIFSVPGLHPDAWNDCAVAAGLRPATSLCPGFWRLIAALFYKAGGITGGDICIAIAGKVAVGAIAALSYLTFRDVLATLVRMVEPHPAWTGWISRSIAGVSALLLAMADPVWSLGHAFTPHTLLAVVFSAITFLFAHFIASGKVRPAYWAMFVSGLFCAESPFGFIALASFWLLFYVLLTKGGLFHVKLLEPLAQQSSKWLLTFLWATGLLVGATADVLGFIAFRGMEATGTTAGGLPLAYVQELWKQLAGAANAGGWILALGVAFMPFVLGIALLRRATDMEYFLSYHVGLVFFATGCVGYSQLASLQPIWFWTLGNSIQINSPLLLATCSFMSAAAVMCTLATVAADAFCRDHRRLAAQFNPDIDETKAVRHSGLLRHLSAAAVLAALVAGAVPARVQRTGAKMAAIISDYVKETVTEAGDAKYLFTDGAYDCAIEMESARRGGNLACISLLPGRGGRNIWAVKQIMPDDEDRLSAEVGGANVLRTWQRDKPERIGASAMQLGLELWRYKSGREYPPVSGVLARTTWKDRETLQEGVRRGYTLVERILSLYANDAPKPVCGKALNDLFQVMQWRLARLARIRSELADRDGDVARAADELRICDALDDRNESLKRILEGMTRLREHTMRQMTPREGLHFALVRADFSLAKRYAEPILDADPYDIDANFGVGMSYLEQEQFSRAEEYLSKCLERNKKEPAFWNNIAVVQCRLGRLAEARKNAEKALSLLPDSAEIKDTLAKIEAAEKAKAKEDAKSAAATKDGKKKGKPAKQGTGKK